MAHKKNLCIYTRVRRSEVTEKFLCASTNEQLFNDCSLYLILGLHWKLQKPLNLWAFKTFVGTILTVVCHIVKKKQKYES